MKKYITLLLFASLLINGCDKDDDFINVDGQPPTLVLTNDKIATEPGREFVIKGRVEDKDGLRSINLKNADLNLDKTIDLTLQETLYEYDLNYKFKTFSTLEGFSYPLEITVTDLGGRQTKSTILVTMDGDFNHPVFTVAPDNAVTVLLKSITRLNVKFSVTDDKALETVKVEIPEIGYQKELTEFNIDNKSLDFNDAVTLPSVLATYELHLTAVDKAGLETKKTSKITVSEMPDFPKMYLTDVASPTQLNNDIFGKPMLVERVEPYTYRARYYSEAAGTEIRFLPQKTDFSPISFGIDPLNATALTDDPEVSKPIVLPTKGYYEINFNVKTGNYQVKPYTPTEEPLAIGKDFLLDGTRPAEGSIPLQIGLVGAGIPNAGNWSTSSPLILKQDSENKYLFSVEMDLTAGSELEFIISVQHAWGWWPEPFWRWDRSNDPEANVANGGENPGKWKVGTTGKYIFKFDTHLKRSQFYPKN